MVDLVAQHLPELEELCRRYNVERLELFGSAATGEFDPEQSDIDLLATFGPSGEIGAFRQFIDFLLDCEDLFGRDVDLSGDGAIRNPYLREAVEEQRTLLCASGAGVGRCRCGS